MAKDTSPAFQFYPEKFTTGTADMSAEQVGGYIRLLCYQWHKGGLPDNDKKLRQLSGVSLKNLKEILKKFEKDEDGFLKNSRLEITRNEQNEYRKRQSVNAKNGWQKRNATALPSHIPLTMPLESQNDALYSVSIPITNTVESATLNFRKLTSEQQLELGAMACKTTIEAYTAYAKEKAMKLIAAGYCEKYGPNSVIKMMIEDYAKVKKDFEFQTKTKNDFDDKWH